MFFLLVRDNTKVTTPKTYRIQLILARERMLPVCLMIRYQTTGIQVATVACSSQRETQLPVSCVRLDIHRTSMAPSCLKV